MRKRGATTGYNRQLEIFVNLHIYCYIMKSNNCYHLRHITLLLVDKVTDFLPFTFFHTKVVRGHSHIILHRKSSIRSQNLIQVYSIKSRTIKKCNSPRCQENFTFFYDFRALRGLFDTFKKHFL